MPGALSSRPGSLQKLGNKPFLSNREWPSYDQAQLKEKQVEIAVQVNGKVKGRFSLDTGASNDDAEKAALKLPKIQEALSGREIKKVIVVPNRLVNIVVK